MATRTDNPITLTAHELKAVLEALQVSARKSYAFAGNKRHSAATRSYAKQQADESLSVRDAIVRRMYTWT